MIEGIWAREQAFWTASAAEALRDLDDAAIMVFGPTGILQGDAIAPTLRDAPRWSEVAMTERHATRTDEVVVLAYRATARRDGKDHRALCSSTWLMRADGWKLIAHQQTPL
ncbi:nuclear transport factor 2 family protein [Paracoccus stylophorae]|uniref:Nuclear transport factor 2 family protein n=1 Tax=Paracoccus stylophorae TaxID=659350 RepID=A0ABY7SQZ2_9RHOB|nr:nuclear transport factor 2 family protein [Paracoccus stylophorae]WCR09266.1 nuclear transport factor 2 family protein [Paracoccus stylophorae]